MSDLKVGDIVKFTNNNEYVYTNSRKKTVGKIVPLEEYDFTNDSYYNYKDINNYYVVKVIAMENEKTYHNIVMNSHSNGVYPVEKEYVLPYDGEYDNIPSVKELLLKTDYVTIFKQKISRNKQQYDINKFLLGGF